MLHQNFELPAGSVLPLMALGEFEGVDTSGRFSAKEAVVAVDSEDGGLIRVQPAPLATCSPLSAPLGCACGDRGWY